MTSLLERLEAAYHKYDDKCVELSPDYENEEYLEFCDLRDLLEDAMIFVRNNV
jgi:hypothetical protein